MKLCSGSRAPGGQFPVAVIKEKNCALRQWEVASATRRPMGCPPLGGPPLDCADPGRGTAVLWCPRAQGELVGEGGTCFGGSTALCRFLRRVGGVRLQVYISDPSTHSRGRLSLVVKGTPSSAWPAVLLSAFPGMPRPLGSCLLYLAIASPVWLCLPSPPWIFPVGFQPHFSRIGQPREL